MTMQSFDPSQFDPGKMDPKLLLEISQLVRELPPDKLTRMQSLMHNMMAGFDVRSVALKKRGDLFNRNAAFEKTIKRGMRFRNRQIMSLLDFF